MKKITVKGSAALALLLCGTLTLSGCSPTAAQSTTTVTTVESQPADTAEPADTTELFPTDEVELEDERVPLSALPASLPTNLTPVASGTLVNKNSFAELDYSNTKDGYIMVRYIAATSQRLKAQVTGPATTYTYNLKAGEWTTFPLSDGNGHYKVAVFENVSGTKYSAKLTASFDVTLSDEFAPFLRPNQYVNYLPATNTVAKAAELTKGLTDPLKMVEKVYDYVVKNVTYDRTAADTVQSGYLPVLDNVLATKKGICFDYAALMTGMLRSQGVPCKLVVGYAGTAYHAWVSVWTKETGWIDGVIYFDGNNWQRMDPTFASSGDRSDSIMQYIGDGKNYTTKYLY